MEISFTRRIKHMELPRNKCLLFTKIEREIIVKHTKVIRKMLSQSFVDDRLSGCYIEFSDKNNRRENL